MDVNLLRIFLSVAKHKSISLGAEALCFAQSNVTSRIKQLEKTLECKLFHRVPKGVVLTHEGEKLFPYALKLVQQTDAMLLAMNNKIANKY